MEQTPQTRLMISAWVISALPGRRHTNGWCILHKAIVSWEQTSTSNQQPKRLFSWGWNCPYKSVCQVHVCSSADTYLAMEFCSTRCKCGLIPIRFSRKNKAFGPFSHCTIWHHLFNSCSDPLRLRWAIFQGLQRLAIWSDWLSCSLKKNHSLHKPVKLPTRFFFLTTQKPHTSMCPFEKWLSPAFCRDSIRFLYLWGDEACSRCSEWSLSEGCCSSSS